MSAIYFSFISSLIALIVAGILAIGIKKKRIENSQIKEVSSAIQEGAKAFLNREYTILFPFIVVVGGLLVLINYKTSIAFIFGALLSILAGNIGMRIATASNGRCCQALSKNLHRGLVIAFDSGTVMAMSIVGLGVLGIVILYLIFRDPRIMYGFGFGASSVALFARLGGGIYTKGADMGADLVGKVEENIPEDDPRNPAVIADNVGDNVGDVAGMGADLFESYVDAIIGAMVLGSLSVAVFGSSLITLPLVLAGVGILSSLLGNLLVRINKNTKSSAGVLNASIWFTTTLVAIVSFFVFRFLSGSLNLFWAFLFGLAGGIGIGQIAEYYTSNKSKPTQQIAAEAQTGAATNVISGLSVGMESTFVSVLLLAIVIFFAYFFGKLYGIAIAAVGMLSTLGTTLATDTFGPVVDNAAGIAEMSHVGGETRKRAEALDALGNTTAAIGKGFAMGAAGLTALVLLVSYGRIIGLHIINLLQARVVIGLFLGGMVPFFLSSFAMSAVSKTAMKMIKEVRDQFKNIPGLLEGEGKPDYKKCVDISTKSALKEMILPGIIAVIFPPIVGFSLGKEALAGFLAGAIVTGFLLAITMANSGAALDNAKKYVEEGNFGGKGSEAHKSAVVGDTVGDPLKDTAGPSLNILIKLMAIVSLIIAPLL